MELCTIADEKLGQVHACSLHVLPLRPNDKFHWANRCKLAPQELVSSSLVQVEAFHVLSAYSEMLLRCHQTDIAAPCWTRVVKLAYAHDAQRVLIIPQSM